MWLYVPTPPELHFISLCTGGGGLDLGVELANPAARAVCLVEREAFAVATLVEAMEIGLLAPAPVWSDVRSFDGRRWRGLVDGVVGGIPCQPHSLAGRRLGRDDPRDLWGAARRIVVQSGAWWVLIENVPGMLSSGGAERVWRDLGRLGFEREIGLFSAAEVGASHERQRLFILGVADRERVGRITRGRPLEAGHWSAEFDATDGHSLLADTDGAGSSLWPVRAGDRGAECAAAVGIRRDDLGDADGERQPQPRRDLAEGGGWTGDAGGGPMGDVQHCGREGREPNRGWAGTTLSPDCGLPLSPPGPGDADGWRAVVERFPDFAPAAESWLRRVADGLARGLDRDVARTLDAVRADRLRLLGNGVHPLAAAYAFRTLATRLAARGSVGATRLVRMMG